MRFLRAQGLVLLIRNFACRCGEIDLILEDSTPIQSRVLVFTEVRYRRSHRYGGSAASVGAAKQRRIANTAAFFRQRHREFDHVPCRFDVVAVSGAPGDPDVCWIKAAFGG